MVSLVLRVLMLYPLVRAQKQAFVRHASMDDMMSTPNVSSYQSPLESVAQSYLVLLGGGAIFNCFIADSRKSKWIEVTNHSATYGFCQAVIVLDGSKIPSAMWIGWVRMAVTARRAVSSSSSTVYIDITVSK